MKTLLRTIAALSSLLVGASASAQNVDLSTLPERASVQLTIYNSEDLTLVRETRRLSFKEGRNRLQFSWQNTRIDPTSVELRFLSHRGELELVDTAFPHAKPHMLYWNVHSERAGDALVEVSYFTSGISWAADYVAILEPKAERMSLESYVRIVNQSGEDYEGAEVRLVVGSLNLVERIAELAGVAPTSVQKLDAKKLEALRHRAARRAITESEDMMFADESTAGASVSSRPKDVKKASLSEYYLFTIEGRETVPSGWSKRLRSFAARDVPYRLLHRYRPAQYGDHLERVLEADNDEASKLGQGPLPDGVVRVFSRSPSGGLAYVGAQAVPYVPAGEELEVRLGPDPEVRFERVVKAVRRADFELDRGRVVGWEERTLYARVIENLSRRPLRLELRERFSGDATFVSAVPAARHDATAVQIEQGLAAGARLELPYVVAVRHGRRAKQAELRLEPGDPASLMAR